MLAYKSTASGQIMKHCSFFIWRLDWHQVLLHALLSLHQINCKWHDDDTGNTREITTAEDGILEVSGTCGLQHNPRRTMGLEGVVPFHRRRFFNLYPLCLCFPVSPQPSEQWVVQMRLSKKKNRKRNVWIFLNLVIAWRGNLLGN